MVSIGEQARATPILVRKVFWGNSEFAEAIKQSKKESKQSGPVQQKTLPVGYSDRPGGEDPSWHVADSVDHDSEQQPEARSLRHDDRYDVAGHTARSDQPVVESSRTAALFTSEFMSKE